MVHALLACCITAVFGWLLLFGSWWRAEGIQRAGLTAYRQNLVPMKTLWDEFFETDRSQLRFIAEKMRAAESMLLALQYPTQSQKEMKEEQKALCNAQLLSQTISSLAEPTFVDAMFMTHEEYSERLQSAHDEIEFAWHTMK
jgi:hypothetical protein